ncbi:hypothetical protein [Dickeya chrysanthemi]|uniref:hypothetical protein n=2 Tax=Dickeya chrysanthemi TaxID=556 RepID=UPI001C8E2AAC|nr:hypothetical protein [Dickeya chrysanthemi]MBX9445857.1 hypothetical protein [Dickeya chrysanthemi]
MLKSYTSPLPNNTFNWDDFNAYILGNGGIIFSGLMLIGLIMTLSITIKNNNKNNELIEANLRTTTENHKEQLELQKKFYKKEVKKRRKEYALSLIIRYVNALNNKLDNKKYHVWDEESQIYTTKSESEFLEFALSRYNNHIDSDESDDSGKIKKLPFSFHFHMITNEMKVKYFEETLILEQIIKTIDSFNNEQFKLDLINVFLANTSRERTFWLLVYAEHSYKPVKYFFEAHSKQLLIMPEAIMLSQPTYHKKVSTKRY